MAVSVPQNGHQVLCTTVGMYTDLEALVANHGSRVTVTYSRVTASQQRRVHLVEQYQAGDPMLVLELGRLRVI